MSAAGGEEVVGAPLSCRRPSLSPAGNVLPQPSPDPRRASLPNPVCRGAQHPHAAAAAALLPAVCVLLAEAVVGDPQQQGEGRQGVARGVRGVGPGGAPPGAGEGW